MSDVQIKKINEVYSKIIAEPSIIMDLHSHFEFEVPGAKFTPAFKNKVWNGKINLLNRMTCLLYAGLSKKLEEVCSKLDYEVEYLYDNSNVEFSIKEAQEFIKSLNIPEKYAPREYQVEAFVKAVRESRMLMLSPTSSGKSLIIYLLVQYYSDSTLIIVPNTQLVSQLAGDFADYGYDSDTNVHKVFAGQAKVSDKLITISTWQSVYKLKADYFNNFGVIIGDEAHLFKAKSLVDIMTKLTECKYRFGTTGTLDGTETNKLVLEGLFGPVHQVITTKELMEKKFVAGLRIKGIVLSYPDEVRKASTKLEYQDEMNYLVGLEARNKFIRNLALSLKGNTLLLFQYVDKHGKLIFNDLKNEIEEGRALFYISGEIDGQIRNEIRQQIENEENSITVASFGTFSTGTNIKRLHNIIYASPSKSKIRNLQSIGRSLRLHDSKDVAMLYDIADDLSWKTHKNFTLLHMIERVKQYASEGFDYKMYNVKLKC